MRYILLTPTPTPGGCTKPPEYSVTSSLAVYFNAETTIRNMLQALRLLVSTLK